MTPSSVVHLDPVRLRVRLDDLAAPDRDLQRQVLRAIRAVAERHTVNLGGHVDVGARLVVLAGSPVCARTLRLVRQPRPAALGGRIGGDDERAFDRGLVFDRRAELHDDRRRDPDRLAVGELELAADGGRRLDRGEPAVHRDRGAVAADDRPCPRVRGAVAERLGHRVRGSVLAERPRDDLAVGVGQRDPLEPAVADRGADLSRRNHVSCRVAGLKRHGRLGGWRGDLVLFARFAETRRQKTRRSHPDRERSYGTAAGDPWHVIGWCHVDPGYGKAAAGAKSSVRPAPVREST